MRRKTIIFLATIAILVSGAVVAWPYIDFYMLTGRFTPIHQIETLQDPVAVSKWSSDGLHLADGRIMQLPGLRSLPVDSAALAEATKRGVEIHPDGHVLGLVRIHHWCGNDPVTEHIVRIDLSELMLFLRAGEPVAPTPAPEYLVTKPGGAFTESGWRIDDFMDFNSWKMMKTIGK